MKPSDRFTRMRHRITLQSFTETGVDARGQPTGSWGDVATVPGHVHPLAGRIAEYAHQLFPLATHEIVIRYRDDVTRQYRATSDGRTFAIGHVENVDERGRWLRLLVAEEEA